MSIEQKAFGKSMDGREVTLYTISNNKGMKAAVTDFGAILVNLFVPGAEGRAIDVVLGYDKAEDYHINACFLGATIGPNANRIAEAKFEIDATTYLLDVNDGTNNLHSHREKGYHKKMWKAHPEEMSVTFTLEDEDGALGFPGHKTFRVTYALDEDNGLTITYHGESDKKTVLNPTNHTYFNLDGHNSGSVTEHELWLNASHYTPVIAGSIPTGEIAPVAGTPMNFTSSKKIETEIDADFQQLTITGGYDHNWVLDGWDGSLQHFATVTGSISGICMKAYTTLPGVQFYAGNFIEQENGKDQAIYRKRGGLCLETQYYPNSVNQPEFPSCVFGADKSYDSITVYKFS